MAAITPVASTGTGGVDVTRGVYTGEIAAGEDLITDGVQSSTRNNYVLEIYYFADVDDDDTWTSNIAGIQGVALQIDEGRTVVDGFCAILETAASGLIRFKASDVSDNAGKGWLWVLIDPSVARRGGIPTR